MILISHRGNVSGPRPELENSRRYIEDALRLGFDVEVDVWLHEGKFFLGHDHPQHLISASFLKNPSIWAHAKCISTLRSLIDNNVHCFFHEHDAATLTSQGYVWTHPNQILTPGSIAVMPEKGFVGDLAVCHAMCSDYVGIEGKFK